MTDDYDEIKKPELYWTKVETQYLIHIYKNYPILYDRRHPQYIRVANRNAAYKEITKEMQKVKPEVNIRTVKSKVKTLHSQLSVEKRRQKKIARESPGEYYRPKLWCYHDLLFLKNINKHDEQYEEENKTFVVPPLNDDNIIVKNEIYDDEDDDVEFRMNINSSEMTYPNANTNIVVANAIATGKNFKSTNNGSSTSSNTTTTTTTAAMIATTKEDMFCNYLSTELQSFKLEETFDKIKVEIFALVAKFKAEEREMLKQRSSLTAA